MRASVVAWLPLGETDADEKDSQLAVEENLECSLLLETWL